MKSSNDNGFDLIFGTGYFPDGSSVVVKTDCAILSSQTTSSIHIERVGDWSYYRLYDDAGEVESYRYPFRTYITLRVLYHGGFITIYMDNYWIHTFYPPTIVYQDRPTVKLSGLPGPGDVYPIISNIIRRDLSDWRNAIWIDLETSSQNAIQSIIQQRPIEIFGTSDGGTNFIYERSDRPEVPILNVRRMSTVISENGQLASDAIVYYTDVKVIVDQENAKNHGFTTRMVRVPDLDSGAIRAARVTLKKARQNSKRITLTSRVNPSIEIGDIAVVDMSLSGTGMVVQRRIIVETIGLNLRDGNFSMKLDGRNDD